jgi:hypothetical protein
LKTPQAYKNLGPKDVGLDSDFLGMVNIPQLATLNFDPNIDYCKAFGLIIQHNDDNLREFHQVSRERNLLLLAQ